MEGGREVLEGGWRLTRIRRIKSYLYLIQVIFAIVTVIILIFSEKAFSLKPFYLPINSFVYFLLLMGVIIGAESFYFRTLEMKFARSMSSKSLMAKRFIRRSVIIIGICVAVIIILKVPFIYNTFEDAMSTSGTVSSVVEFNNKDHLGLISVNWITIESDGNAANVYVVSSDYYSTYASDLETLKLHRINYRDYSVDASNPTIAFNFPDAKYDTFYIVVQHLDDDPSPLTYTLHRNISSIFLDYVPLFALIFIVVYAIAIVYLSTLRKRYAGESIYR
jgi:magnesium-transporting ATPase (P-type)